MQCPKCGERMSVETTRNLGPGEVWRLRKCQNCDYYECSTEKLNLPAEKQS